MVKKGMKKFLAGMCAVLVMPTGTVQNVLAKQPEQVLPVSEEKAMNQELKLWYNSPANINTAESSSGEWMQQSLPLGNGNLGNLIFGGIAKERIHFNEKTLWTGGPSPKRPDYQFGNKATAYTQEEIQEYRNLLDDKSKNVFNDDPSLGGYGMGAKIRFPGENNLNKGTYQDFGDIWLDFSEMGINDKNVKDYRRELDIQTGIAATEFSYKDATYKREHFVSNPDQVMVTELSASEKGKLDLKVKVKLNNDELEGKTTFDKENQTCTIEGKVKDNDLKFCTTMKLVLTGGKLSVDEKNQVYQIQDADRVMIVMAAETDYKNDYPTYRDKNKDLEKVVADRVNNGTKKSYDELKETHIADHQGLFDRVSLDLGEQRTSVPTNQLVDEYRKGNYSHYLEVLAFQYGRYLTIAGSRGTLPSNLVGLWTVGKSAWTGDYHFNVNVQMNYWPVYATNLAECGTTFVDYMDKLREPGRLTAERVHGIEGAVKNHTGFTVHTENNPFGMTAPTNAQEYGWNPTGAAWAIQNLWWHYEFTQDEAYLKNTIYPIMKEAALFWDSYLWTSKYQKINDENSPYNGQNRLVVAPSFSEEQGPTAIGTTYDQSLVWELYNECIKAGKIVGEDEALLKSWEEKMQKLDPIEINDTNGIKEWYEETRVGQKNGHNKSYAQAGNLAEIEVPNSGWNIGHLGEQRHASHLVGLFPGTLINKENEAYMNAAIQSLTERGEYSTGWSKANKINLWARTENGEKAYTLLNHLIGGNSSGLQYNLFDSHGSGGGDTMLNGTPVWQIDGNFGLTSGVAEMLVQSQSGYTQFLPAIPSAWEKGEVQGLKARGNFTIGEKWANGMAETFTVCYDGDKESSTFVGSYQDITSAKVYADGKEIAVTKEEETGRISFEAKAGKTYTIDMSETNVEELKEQATAFLKQLHPDLLKIKEELQSAIDHSLKELGSILTKAKQMDQLYRTYLQEAENVYYLTDQEGLAYNEIDTIYNQLRELRNTLLENTGDMEYYQKAESQLTDTAAQLEKQMENRVISFSKDSGIIGEDQTLALSKSEKAANYEIRYTTDGSVPRKTSENYEKPLQLSDQEDTVVRAALFYKEQRVSPVYTKKYMTEGIAINDVTVSHTTDWGATYTKEKMIDGDSSTRWASKTVDNSKQMEITLKLAKKEPISQMKFDLFVSDKNGIGAFEIQALVDGTYQTVYEGTKMGDINDKVGDVDGSSGGYHAYYLAEFPEVTTDSVKVILKAGFVGEPSLYEVTPLNVGVGADGAGDATELDRMLKLAEAADRTSEYYVNAQQTLKDAFEESISDGKEMSKASQDVIDSRTEFLSNRYDRLGFGETDKSSLEALIARAEEALKGEYTNESLYQLKKVLAEAKEVLADESVKQPTVDQMTEKLQKALGNLEQDGFEEIQVPASELQGSGKWIQAGNFKATADDNAGALTYEFSGHSIQVPTVKGNDHGVIRVTIQEQSGKQVYREEIDTYAAERAEGVELMQAEFSEGTYTIQFERVGKSSQAPNTKGWVEVGALTIRKEKKETVDRSRLEEELKICEGLNEKEYTTESWTALQEVVKSATELLAKPDEETCTSEMNDKAAEVEAARANLQKVTVDISELKEVIETAKAISSEGYTKESFEALKQGIREAEALLNGTYTQDEVNEKAAILKQRISGLRADKTALQEKYDKIKDMTQGQATDASWEEFTGLREQAKNVLDNPNATPREVSEILEKLNKFEFTYKDKDSGEEDKKDPNPGVSGDSEQQGTSDTSHKKESVKTGDTTAVAVPIAGIVGVAVLLYVMRKRRKIES
ncbi:glycosyl hydrolase family 95 catalytic domain-containing protein [Faecalimonas sp. LCP19S3_D12]